MNRIGEGDLSTRIQMSGEDELQQISRRFNDMGDRLEQYIDKMYTSEIKQKNAELVALQSQINPHFLYNTLESIRMKAYFVGAKEVGQMIYSLSVMFKNMVKKSTMVTVEEEIDMCSVYLDLFRIRYEGRLETEIEVDPEIQSLSIIKLLVQPIVENYIVHGFRPLEDNNKISVRAHGAEDRVVITVSDNGTGIPEDKLIQIRQTLDKVLQPPDKGYRSIGLMNVHERIVLNYGSDYGVTIRSTEGQGTEVRMEIPKLRKGRRHEERIFVDDEPLIAQGLATIVDWQEYDLHVSGSANDGLQALEKLKEEPVDLLITDIMMPRMNGLELIKKVKPCIPAPSSLCLAGMRNSNM